VEKDQINSMAHSSVSRYCARLRFWSQMAPFLESHLIVRPGLHGRDNPQSSI